MQRQLNTSDGSVDLIELITAARGVVGSFAPSAEVEAGSVGAAILSASGALYTGICIDTRCSLGFCAEHSAIAEMLKHREAEISLVVAVRENGSVLAPCGRCRELMWQLHPKNRGARVVLSESHAVPLEELLPSRAE